MRNLHRVLVLTLFAVILSPSTVSARDPASSQSLRPLHPNFTSVTKSGGDSSQVETISTNDHYSLAPLIQDVEHSFYMAGSGQATSQPFNEEWKVLGDNVYGSAGGELWVIEKTRELSNGDIQISIQVSAVDAQGDLEPWVDESHAGSGFSHWRLDVATLLGGTNKITPDGEFEVTGSGVALFKRNGEKIDDYSLDDDSDSVGLAGFTIIGWNDGTEVAGYDMASMIVYWNIKIDNGDTGFDVSGGQSGAWYDPSHNGEGFILQVISESQAVVYWFTYDKNGKQYWMIGVGAIEGSRITFSDLQTTKGGKFGPEFDPDDVQRIHWGTLELNFASCDNAVATYSGPTGFGSGTLNVTRLSSIWGVNCAGDNESVSSTGNAFLSPGFSGSWFDVRHDGEGFTVEILDETSALIYWFTYDTDGNQAWMMLIAEISGASIFTADVYQPSGPQFGPSFDPDDLVLREWGAAVFSFGTCATSGHGGSMRYLPPADFGLEGTQLLNRLVFIEGLPCNFLSGTYDIAGTMTVAENIVIDTDVNDPNVEEVPNDPGDGLPEQQLVPPARVAGFVTAEPTGVEGERFELEADETDVFILSLREGEGVTLTVSDWDPSDKEAVDLDLYLLDVNDTGDFVDTSLSVEEVETVVAPYDGNFFIDVHAASGQSNYLLQSGQSSAQSNAGIDLSSQFVPNQVMASILDEVQLQSATGSGKYRNRVEQTEQKFGLTRISENAAGDLLYEVNGASMPELVPHPLSLAGHGSISPEQWRVARLAKQLSANPDYRWAGPNYVYDKFEVPNDPGYSVQWHYDQIRLPDAWDITRGSETVIAAVIDTGVWPHADLSSNVNYSIGYDFVSLLLNAGDGNGIDSDASDPGNAYPSFQPYVSHGTHVAGTIGAQTDNGTGVAGVNWNIDIMPVRVLGVSGGSCHDINQGLRWAGRLSNDSGHLPAKQADVINLSLGGSAPCPGAQDIINQLSSRGIIVIAAAGNEGTLQPMYPASLVNVVSVSATTLADDLADYSSYGPTVDVSAPGGDTSTDLNRDSYPDGVLSPTFVIEEGTSNKQSGYLFLQGTSMAAPHLAGVAALMKSTHPEMGPGDFNTAVSSGKITTDLAQNGETSKDPKFGYGRIDALKAVEWAVAADQGQQTDAFMASSSAAIDFSSELQSEILVIEKAGTGNLTISDFVRTDLWISISPQNVGPDGFGQYRVTVDRTGLVEGQYAGWVGFDASDGSRLWISILMRVGDSIAGEAGYVYALLLDQWTVENVKYWHGTQHDDGFDIALSDLPPGTYYLLVSTDLDRDFTVCDEGELCEIYPSNSTVSAIEVTNRDVQLGTFRMGFPIPNLESQSQPVNSVKGLARENGINSTNPLRFEARLPRE